MLRQLQRRSCVVDLELLVGGQSRTRVSRRETNCWLTTNASDNHHTGLDWLKLKAVPAGMGEEDPWMRKKP